MNNNQIEIREEQAEIVAKLVIKYHDEICTSMPDSMVIRLLVNYQKYLLLLTDKELDERLHVA